MITLQVKVVLQRDAVLGALDMLCRGLVRSLILSLLKFYHSGKWFQLTV